MKTSFITLAAIAAGLTSAQQFPGVPTCAEPCLVSAIGTTGCDLANTTCHCDHVQQIRTAVADCILKACTAPGDLSAAINGGLARCPNLPGASALAGAHPAAPSQSPSAHPPTTPHGSPSPVNATNMPAGTGGVTPGAPAQVAVGGGAERLIGAGGLGALALALFAFVL